MVSSRPLYTVAWRIEGKLNGFWPVDFILGLNRALTSGAAYL
jgi:hypothetical protein